MSAAKRKSLTPNKSTGRRQKANTAEQQAAADAFVKDMVAQEVGEVSGEVSEETDIEPEALPDNVIVYPAPITHPQEFDIDDRTLTKRFGVTIEVERIDNLDRLLAKMKLKGMGKGKEKAVVPSRNDLINEGLLMLLADIKVGEKGDIQAAERAGRWLDNARERRQESLRRKANVYESEENDRPLRDPSLRVDLAVYNTIHDLASRLKIKWLTVAPSVTDLISESVQEMLDCYGADAAEDPDSAAVGEDWIKRAKDRYVRMLDRKHMKRDK